MRLLLFLLLVSCQPVNNSKDIWTHELSEGQVDSFLQEFKSSGLDSQTTYMVIEGKEVIVDGKWVSPQ